MVIVRAKLLIKTGWTLKLFKTLIGDRCSSRSSLNDTVSGLVLHINKKRQNPQKIVVECGIRQNICLTGIMIGY
jgi:hypothetical protein